MTKVESDYFIDRESAPRVTLGAGIETTILSGYRGEKMMIVLTEVAPGTTVLAHSHPHEQIGMVYSGMAKMRIGGENKVMEKGDFCRIPSNTEHEAACLGDVPFIMLDIFHPVREDFIQKITG